MLLLLLHKLLILACFYGSVRPDSQAQPVLNLSVRPVVSSKLVNLIFCKRMNRFWSKLAQIVLSSGQGRETFNFGPLEARRSKFKVTRGRRQMRPGGGIFLLGRVAFLRRVPKKHVTTSSTISWTGSVRLQHLLPRVQAIDRYFYFPPYLLCAPTLPWETVNT